MGTCCKYGKQMRAFRDRLIYNLNSAPLNLNNNNLVYGKFKTINSMTPIIKYLIVLGNYIIYKLKMKKHYCFDSRIELNQTKYEFIGNLKRRIICDHHRLNIVFHGIWF